MSKLDWLPKIKGMPFSVWTFSKGQNAASYPDIDSHDAGNGPWPTKTMHASEYQESQVVAVGDDGLPDKVSLMDAVHTAMLSIASQLKISGHVVAQEEDTEISVVVQVRVKTWPAVPGLTTPAQVAKPKTSNKTYTLGKKSWDALPKKPLPSLDDLFYEIHKEKIYSVDAVINDPIVPAYDHGMIFGKNYTWLPNLYYNTASSSGAVTINISNTTST